MGWINFRIPWLKNICEPFSRILEELHCSWSFASRPSVMVNVPRVDIGDASFFFTFNQSLRPEEILEGVKVSSKESAEWSLSGRLLICATG
jgi:hypothetical protein